MATYDNSVKQAAYARIKQLTTEDVRFDGSQWWHQRANGHWQIAPGNAAFYSAILDAEQDKVVSQKAKAAPVPSPAAPAPAPSTRAPSLVRGVSRQEYQVQQAWSQALEENSKHIPTMSASHALASYSPMAGGLHLGGIGAGLGSTFSRTASGLGSAIGIGSIPNLMTMGSMVMSGITMAATTIVGVATAAIGTVTGIAVASLLASKQYAAQVWGMSVSSGMSVNQAGGNVAHLRALGLSPEQVPGMGSNVLMQSMMAPMLGMSGPGDLLGMARAYQARRASGPMGLMMAQGMLGAGGYAGAEGTLAMPLPLLQRQIQRGDSMTSAFGMDAGHITSSQNNLNLLMASVSQFFELMKLKVADTLLPYLTGALDKAIAYVGGHGKEISDFIVSAVETSIRWLGALGNFLYTTLPNAVAGGLAFMLRAGAVVAGGLETGFRALVDYMPNILGGIDALINGFHGMVATIVGIGAFIKSFWNGLVQGISSAFQSTTPGPNNTTGGVAMMNQGNMVTDVLQGIGNISGLSGLSVPGRIVNGVLDNNPLAAYDKARNAQIAMYQPSSIAANYTTQFQGYAGIAADTAHGAIKTQNDYAQRLEDWRDQRGNTTFDVEALLAELKKISASSDKTATNTDKTANGLTGFGSNIIGVMQAQQAQDVAANLMSISPTQ